MSLSSLQVLANHRDALLLAEVAAWLHDIGKCADEHIINQASDKPQNYSYKYKTAQSNRLPSMLTEINLLGESVSVQTLIEQGMPRIISDTSQLWLLRALGKCHAVSHVEKELSDRDTATKQPKGDTRLSTAYGIEGAPASGLTARLDSLPFGALANRSSFVPQVKAAFDHALGDTRRPVNEVTLADWSGAVAALYKSALSGALLGVKPDPDNLHWRLLRVNFDVLGLYAKAIKIADLLSYQNAFSEACKQVKQLVEEEYPLGNEIYRDSSGIYFTFPDLDLPIDLEKEIRRRVEDVEPELAPRIAVTVGDGQTAQDQLKSILGKARREAIETLKQPFDSENLSPCWEQLWRNFPAKDKWEVCPVCRLRPKEEQAETCPHCEARRESRIETWKKQPERTIWVGEIADHNDRVALLVGKFALDDWLSGGLVQTLLVKSEPNNPNGCVPKNPSPARLRRVWETCQRFWEETICNDILPQNSGANARRKLIVPSQENWQEGLYNGKVNGKPIDLFWQSNEKAFLTISNLEASGTFQPGDTVLLERPETKRKAEFQIQEIRQASTPFDHYQPFLPLHTSPDQFLALVPAAEALKIAEKIRDEYEKQFGKVRNRLPLFLGLIYAERKMPLMAMMDSARAMLDSSQSTVNREQWKLKSNPQPSADGQTLTLAFENGITWKVPVKMGDGQTEDVWYPYFALENAPAQPRTRQFQHNNKTWVHVQNLQQDDVVSVTPSRFDFLWLDTAARRFEAGYGENGRRPSHPSRPFYLEDLDRLESVWATFSKLSRTQQKQVLQTIETARARWFTGNQRADSDETFPPFVADTLANAEWPDMSLRGTKQPPGDQEIASPPQAARNDLQTKLITAAVRGELTDLAELHLEILKEKTEEKGVTR